MARPKKFFKSKNSNSNDHTSDFESIVEPVQSAPAKVSKIFKSRNNAPAAPPAPLAPPLRPLEVMPNQPAPPQKSKEDEVMKVPPLKLRLKAGALVAPIEEPFNKNSVIHVQPPPPPVSGAKRPPANHPDPPEVQRSSRQKRCISPPPVMVDQHLSSSEESSEEDPEISFKEPSLIISPKSSTESSPTSRRVLTSPDNKLPSPPRAPSPVYVPPPLKVSRMTEPPKSDNADAKKNNGALRSYSRRPVKPVEEAELKGLDSKPAEPLPEPVKQPEPVRTFSSNRKAPIEDPQPVKSSFVKAASVVMAPQPVKSSLAKAASVATTLNVDRELLSSMPPPSEPGVDR